VIDSLVSQLNESPLHRSSGLNKLLPRKPRFTEQRSLTDLDTVDLRHISSVLAGILARKPTLTDLPVPESETADQFYKKLFEERNKIIAAQEAANLRIASLRISDSQSKFKSLM
jgi:hypothetical protein